MFFDVFCGLSKIYHVLAWIGDANAFPKLGWLLPSWWSIVASDAHNWDTAIAMYLRAHLTCANAEKGTGCLQHSLLGRVGPRNQVVWVILGYYTFEIPSGKVSILILSSFFKQQLPLSEYTFSQMASIVDLKNNCYIGEIKQNGQIWSNQIYTNISLGTLAHGALAQHYVVSLQPQQHG